MDSGPARFQRASGNDAAMKNKNGAAEAAPFLLEV